MKKGERDKLRELAEECAEISRTQTITFDFEPKKILSLLDSYERLVGALKFYADDDNWHDVDPKDPWPEGTSYLYSKVFDDDGEKARQALAEVEDAS